MHGYADGQFASAQTAAVDSFSLPSVNYLRDKVPTATVIRTRCVPNTATKDSSQLLPRDISSRFGMRLRELRRARNMTQLRMAVDFGIDRSFISDVERGRKSISLHMLEVIALGLKVTLSDLLDGV